MAQKKKSKPYVDNKQFLAEMIAFKEKVIEADKNNKPRPRVFESS